MMVLYLVVAVAGAALALNALSRRRTDDLRQTGLFPPPGQGSDADVGRLVQIQGQPPSLLRPPSGCRFHPRCPYVMPICREKDPELLQVAGDPGHLQACHLDEETKEREAAKLLAAMVGEGQAA